MIYRDRVEDADSSRFQGNERGPRGRKIGRDSLPRLSLRPRNGQDTNPGLSPIRPSIFKEPCILSILPFSHPIPNMAKIKSIEYFRVLPRWLFVKVTDQDGQYGWGESTLEGHTEAIEGCLSSLSKRFQGYEAE